MRATLTALIAAIEAAATALLVAVVIAIPALLMWWITFDLASEPQQVMSGIAAVWMLSHLVPIGLSVTAEAALGIGLAPEPLSFVVSLAPLTLTFLTAAMALRGGWRFSRRGGAGLAGVIGGGIGFAMATAACAALSAELLAWPLPLAVLVPTLWFTGWAAVGFLSGAIAQSHPWWRSTVQHLQRLLTRVAPTGAAAFPARVRDTALLTAAGCAALLTLGALGVAIALLAGYVEIASLSQRLQLGALANVLLFLLQLLLLPIAWLWAVAWFTGAGFGIGIGTSVTPFETLLGPVPALPLVGAIPQAWGNAGALAPTLVILCGVAIGVLAAVRTELRRTRLLSALLVVLVATVCIGATVTACMALATGAVGPGRLAVAGPTPVLTGGLAAAELGFGMLCGMLAARTDRERLRRLGAVIPQLRSANDQREARETTLSAHSIPGAPTALISEPEASGRSAIGPQTDAGSIDSQPGLTIASDADASDADAITAPLDPLPPPLSEADTLVQAYSWENVTEEQAQPESRPARWQFRFRRR